MYRVFVLFPQPMLDISESGRLNPLNPLTEPVSHCLRFNLLTLEPFTNRRKFFGCFFS